MSTIGLEVRTVCGSGYVGGDLEDSGFGAGGSLCLLRLSFTAASSTETTGSNCSLISLSREDTCTYAVSLRDTRPSRTLWGHPRVGTYQEIYILGDLRLAQSLVRGTPVSSSRFPREPRRDRDPRHTCTTTDCPGPRANRLLHRRPMIRIPVYG